MDKPVQLEILGNTQMTIVGVVQHVVNNLESSFVHLSPAWLDGTKKSNHIVYLEVIEQISPAILPTNSVELPTMIEQCSLIETAEMLPEVGLPPNNSGRIFFI